MKEETRKIRNKGYTLLEFCEVIGYSLRWYRTHVNKSNKQNDLINEEIEKLNSKQLVKTVALYIGSDGCGDELIKMLKVE